jgi:isopenicillin-N N-acyltransferase like protein
VRHLLKTTEPVGVNTGGGPWTRAPGKIETLTEKESVKSTTNLYAIYVGLLAITLITALSFPAYGSTLWAAAGTRVQGGGTLIAKNYDAKPVPTHLRLVIPRNGFTYLGLFSLKNPKGQGPLAGVNEKGLAVISAIPEALPPGPEARPSIEQVSEKLLAGFGTVDNVLSDQKILSEGPSAFYIIADASQIASVEVTSYHEIAVRNLVNNILCHTDHYIDERFLSRNRQTVKNSELRLERIGRLLNSGNNLLTLDAFIDVAHDRGTNPDEGILRSSGSSDGVRTVATWVLVIPGTRPPELHVGLFDPEGSEAEYDFKLDRAFWTEGLR